MLQKVRLKFRKQEKASRYRMSAAKQEKELMSKFWGDMCEVYGVVLPKTAQGKQITKDFLVSCRQLVNDAISVGNAAQSSYETRTSSSKKKNPTKVEKCSTSKRISASDEKGEPQSKKKVTIEPKVKKATIKKAEIQSPLPSKKKKATK
jgi:hypothetical protein